MFRIFKRLTVTTLLAFCGVASTQATDVKNTLAATDIGHIDFMSANGRTTFRQMYQKTVAFNDAIYGELSLPTNLKPGEKIPAMVIMHSSSGVIESEYAWARFFNEMGIASFIVNSFTP